jgi:CubicO group peptidase (beta-lactamase class C family)
MQHRMPVLRTPGVSVVVVEGDQVLLSRGYGFADREAGTPMTDDTPVPIASTNKGMTALAIMQLVEQGLVELDAPVARYLPDFRMDDARGADMTVRQLLTHTAGIPGGWNMDLEQGETAGETMRCRHTFERGWICG